MAAAPFLLLLVLLSLIWTWWAFFRTCVTIRIADKTRKVVPAGYPGVMLGSKGYSPPSVLHEEYRYFLTDVTGRQWIVSKAAYDLAAGLGWGALKYDNDRAFVAKPIQPGAMPVMKSHCAARIAVVMLGCLIGFQLLLTAGLPLGRAAWGGQYSVLPVNLRLGSLAAAAILGIAAWVILARAGLAAPGAKSLVVRIAAWGFAGYLCLNTLGNLASQSPIERAVMTPATLVLVVCFVIVARSRT